MTIFRWLAKRRGETPTRRAVLWALPLVVSCGARSGLLDNDQKALELLPECSTEGEQRPCQSICGTGTQTCHNEEWLGCTAQRPKAPVLEAIVRDFNASHADFEGMFPDGRERGMVETTLGADDKPVYAGTPWTPSTTGPANFNHWYHTAQLGQPMFNQAIPIEIELAPSTEDPAIFLYRNSAFFPIDDLGFGNEGRPHNFHFTLELSTAFQYVGGETFRFTGDDDLWVFINRQLVIDLGGLHQSLTEVISLDELASDIGLIKNEVYPLHLFFAERHTVASNFNIETTIAEFEFCE